MDADGSNQTRLMTNPADDREPAWSPDGSKLAFARNFEIYAMNADGTGQTQLTHNTAGGDEWPTRLGCGRLDRRRDPHPGRPRLLMTSTCPPAGCLRGRASASPARLLSGRASRGSSRLVSSARESES